jgi:hypothetical protein
MELKASMAGDKYLFSLPNVIKRVIVLHLAFGESAAPNDLGLSFIQVLSIEVKANAV